MVIIKKLIDIWIKLNNNNQKPKGETCKSISWFLDFYYQYEDTHVNLDPQTEDFAQTEDVLYLGNNLNHY